MGNEIDRQRRSARNGTYAAKAHHARWTAYQPKWVGDFPSGTGNFRERRLERRTSCKHLIGMSLATNDPMTTADRQARSLAMTRAEKLDALEAEIHARTPRASARLHISLSNPPIRTAYQTQMRVAGNRDDVLDFIAALYDEVKGMVRPDGTLPLTVQAIESESTEHIQLLLARDLYEG